MSDVTVQEVKNIMKENTSLDKLAPFLADSKAMVEHNKLADTYSTAIVDVIVKYLAAHLASLVVYRNATRVENLDTNASYRTAKGEGLSSTFYGQTVLSFDSEGILSNLGKRKAEMRSMNYIKGEC